EVTHRVETVEDVDALPPIEQPVALLAQTTLSHRDRQSVAARTAERFPELWMPARSDLCFATTNRQSALGAIAERCDVVVVIGSANSSNTRALERLAVDAGAPAVYRVNGPDELPADLSGVVGVTAGASAPEQVVQAVIDHLAPVHGVEEVRITEEDEYFPPPRELRDLLAAIDVLATFGATGAVPDRPALPVRARVASARRALPRPPARSRRGARPATRPAVASDLPSGRRLPPWPRVRSPPWTSPPPSSGRRSVPRRRGTRGGWPSACCGSC